MAPRSDAVANRGRIVAVARRAFAADPEASMNSVAAAAEVGAGTLYRHFPTRESLVLEVYRVEVDALAASVEALLRRRPPAEALRTWVLKLAALVRVKHGLGDALNTAAAQEVIGRTYAPVTAALGTLLDACADAGDVRGGVRPDDLLLAIGCLWRVEPGRAGDARARRLYDLIVQGLAAR